MSPISLLSSPLTIIPNRWYCVLKSRKLRQKPVTIIRFGVKILLFRQRNDNVICFLDRCPHRGVPLSLGNLCKNDEFECPYHGFRFQSDGICTQMPCEGTEARISKKMKVDTFPTKEAHGLIRVWWGASAETLGIKNLPEVPWLPEIPEDNLVSIISSYEWPVATFRAIESNFDVHHTASTHGKGLLRWLKRISYMDSIKAQITEDRIDVIGKMIEPYENKVFSHKNQKNIEPIKFQISFIVPCVSYLRIGTWEIVTLDTPIDENNTWRCVLNFSSSSPIPIAKKLVDCLSYRINYVTTQLWQDLPMVQNQTHPTPDLYEDCLVRADVGVAKYKELRRRLMQEAIEHAEILPSLVRLHLE